jgi:mRNA interferase YafQ
MLDPLYTKPFRKQYKLMKKRGMDISKLIEVMDMIIKEKPLPPKCCNHPLHGKWEGSYDCHIQGDWVLIYKPNHRELTVTFQATGTHSDLDL